MTEPKRLTGPDRFPKVKVSGGPHGKNLEFTVDGEAPERVHRVEIELDVKDIVRIKTYQYAEVDAELESPQVEDSGYKIEVRLPVFDTIGGEMTIKGWTTIATAEGRTLRAAIEALLQVIPEDFDAGRAVQAEWERRLDRPS